MNILMLTTDYPMPQKGESIYTDLAQALYQEGNKVTVIVNEESKNISETCLLNENNIEVLRVRVGNIYNTNLIEKAISFLKSSSRTKNAVDKYLKSRKYDYIIYMSQPVTIAKTVKYLMKKYSCPSYLMLKDIFPQNAVDLKMFGKISPIYWFFRLKEIYMYKTSTIIGCMSQMNKDYLLAHNKYLDKNKVEIFQNTKRLAVTQEELNNYTQYEFRKKLKIPDDAILAVYGGNMGKPQGIDFFLRVLDEYKNNKKIYFLIIARGTEKKRVYEYISSNGFNNVFTYDLMKREDYEKVLHECDVGLIFLDPRFTIPNYPSKSLSYLEYGIPIIAAGDLNNDFKDMLENTGSGFYAKSGDINKYKENLDKLCNNKELKSKMAFNARKCFLDNFTVEKSVQILKYKFMKNGGNEMFKGKTLMITGGTGSFGHAVLNRFLDTDIGEIRIFSRDEKKQDDMRKEYNNDKIKFYIGDVRDLASVKNAIHGVDYIFHAAALKQVPSCEFFPIEAVKTNVLGTDNVLTAAIEEGVKKVICLSTDKAAYPVNAMGTSKAMMEKVIVAKARTVNPERTTICATRYGNVMCSRGSVIPLFIEQIKAGKPLTITEPSMTRFIMSLEEAVELVVFAFQNAEAGDIMVQKAPACTIEVLAQAVKELFGVADTDTKIIGIRHGEKMYETLLTKEECVHAIDMGNFYRVPCDKRDLNYEKYFSNGIDQNTMIKEFNSNNTTILNVEQVKEKLLSLSYVREELENWKKR